MVIGLNEFVGYVGVVIVGIVMGYVVLLWGLCEGLMWFGMVVIGLVMLLVWVGVVEMLFWV